MSDFVALLCTSLHLLVNTREVLTRERERAHCIGFYNFGYKYILGSLSTWSRAFELEEEINPEFLHLSEHPDINVRAKVRLCCDAVWVRGVLLCVTTSLMPQSFPLT